MNDPTGGLEYRDEAYCRARQAECLEIASLYAAGNTNVCRDYAKRFRQQAADWQREIDYFSR